MREMLERELKCLKPSSDQRFAMRCLVEKVSILNITSIDLNEDNFPESLEYLYKYEMYE